MTPADAPRDSRPASDRPAERSALAGLKVLDVSFYAPGRWAAMYLGDLGADVICLERPVSKARGFSMLESDTHFRWLWLQRNKRSLTLDFKSERGKEIYLQLASDADIIVESMRPGSLDRAGIGYETVRERNPSVVYCAVSGYGQTGPHSGESGHEPNYQAIGGLLTFNGTADGVPVISTGLMGDLYGGASQALIGIMAALFFRERTGDGQYIDVSIVDGVLTSVGAPVNQWINGEVAENWDPQYPRQGEFRATGGHPGSRVYETADGEYVVTSAVEPWSWRNFCEALGTPEFVESFDAPEIWDEAASRFREIFMTRPRGEWVELSAQADLGISPVLTPEELLDNDHIRARDMIVEIDYGPLGKVRQVGVPVKLRETPGTIRWIPTYGQHSEEILRELGYDEPTLKELKSAGTI